MGKKIMNRREFLKDCAAVGAGGVLLSNRGMKVRVRNRRPNIIVIMADDIGYEGLSCYGSASYQTPALDELARTGVRFTHCYSQPICTPSRVKIMTGKSNIRNYVRFALLDRKERTFGHVLKDAGYATCVAGKWQLYGGGDGTDPNTAGFDEYSVWNFDTPGDRYKDPTYRENGVLYQNVIGKYGPDIFCDYINGFMERNQDKPFFVYFPMCLVHSPYVPTPDSAQWDDPNAKGKEYFADMIAYMDKLVGRIVAKLDELGLREDTLIMFTGDNGTGRGIVSEMTDGTTIEGAKALTTDAGTRVALVAHWKGTAVEGLVCDDLVDFSDFLPTVVEAAGVELKDSTIDGRSFLPQLLGEKSDPRQWLYCYYDARMSSSKWPEQIFARDKRWKLYAEGDHERSGRLYDIPADVLEENPVAPGSSSEADEARVRLQVVLDSFN